MSEVVHSKSESKILIIYTAEFVKDQKSLLQKYPPKHTRVFAHHSTIVFKPGNLNGIDVGKERNIRILGRVFDEKGDVLLIENPKSNNEHPHITISCANGVSPVYSNELIKKGLESGTVHFFEELESIQMVEGYFDGKKDCLVKE